MRHGYRNENLPQGISTLQLLLVIIFKCKVRVLLVWIPELSPIWLALDYWQFSNSLSSLLILSCNFQQTLHSERKNSKNSCMSFIWPHKQVSSMPTMSDLNMFDFFNFQLFKFYLICAFTHMYNYCLNEEEALYPVLEVDLAVFLSLLYFY